MTMIRVNHYVTKQQWRAIRMIAKETGIPVAELLRRAIDAFLMKAK